MIGLVISKVHDIVILCLGGGGGGESSFEAEENLIDNNAEKNAKLAHLLKINHGIQH